MGFLNITLRMDLYLDLVFCTSLHSQLIFVLIHLWSNECIVIFASNDGEEAMVLGKRHKLGFVDIQCQLVIN